MSDGGSNLDMWLHLYHRKLSFGHMEEEACAMFRAITDAAWLAGAPEHRDEDVEIIVHRAERDPAMSSIVRPNGFYFARNRREGVNGPGRVWGL